MSERIEELVARYHALKKLTPAEQIAQCTTIECIRSHVTRWVRPVFSHNVCYTWDVDEFGNWVLYLCSPYAEGFAAYSVDSCARRLFTGYNEDTVEAMLPKPARALSGIPRMSSELHRRRLRSVLGVRCERTTNLTAIAVTQLLTAAENEIWHFDGLVRDLHRALDCDVQSS